MVGKINMVNTNRNSIPTHFSHIELKSSIISVHLPNSGIRWLLKNKGTEQITTYGQILPLHNNDEIELVEKHSKYKNGCGRIW